MKKNFCKIRRMISVILALLAFLFLLSSCDAAVGTSGESTDGGTEGSVSEPAETTEEGTTDEITTDEITTEEITTEEITTSARDLIDRDWVNREEPISYIELPGLEGEPWYFSWTPDSFLLEEMVAYREYAPLTEEGRRVILETPLRAEVAEHGMLYRFEFFEKYHVSSSMVQIRITVVNDSDTDLYIYDSPYYDTRFKNLNSNNRGAYAQSWFSVEEKWLIAEEPQSYSRPMICLKPGESCCFERILTPDLLSCDPGTPNNDYAILFGTSVHVGSAESPHEWKEVAVPVTVYRLSEESAETSEAE